MHSRHTGLVLGLGVAALFGATLGACFTGEQARGLPCTADSHCGPTLECIAGYCGGVFACDDGSEIPAGDVCNGTPDCPDTGNDEHPELCNSDLFYCDDGSTIDFSLACNEIENCPDGSDEGAAPCLFDECSDEDLRNFAFSPFTPLMGSPMPLGVQAGQMLGSPREDLLFAAEGGTYVRIFDIEGGDSIDLAGDMNGIFVGGIQQVLVHDFDNNNFSDVLVLTQDGRLFAYVSAPPMPPMAIAVEVEGQTSATLDLPEGSVVVDLAMGNVDGNNWADIVVLTEGGVLSSALIDVTGGDEGPFEVQLGLQQLVGSNYTQLQLGDIDGDSIDELLVVGEDSGVKLWVLRRDDITMVNQFWAADQPLPLPGMPSEFMLGNFDETPNNQQRLIDLAFLRGDMGQVEVFRQTGPGVFMPDPTAMPLSLGAPLSGLAVRDMNCDLIDDLVFNVESPPGIVIAFPNEVGALDLADTLTLDASGLPRGSVAITKYDADASWDIFHAVDQSSQIDGPQIRGFVTVPE